ncbi:hypothetical protein HYFRA_00007685 [Hymenoscyphus fraxineus]|uniref:Indoleamine 2,3-dioxygenase n=1 Tax=Hymenoscyphus fraxineus TaxID=746836 RepID=A0A9N9PHE3_9HELO|nr:hypothetical protein HYFRA_00007685 [Hymenoscyphus fraxineus]
MIRPSPINLADFQVSTKNGFLPEEPPLERLSSPYYEPWEAVIKDLSTLLSTSSLREIVDTLPILTTAHLISEPEWQRAYLILAFLTHGYIWENGGPSERLPACLSIPLLRISTHLSLPPTATYAAFNLWNFAPLNPNLPLNQPENLRCIHTFTGTESESWFLLISVAIESHGAPLIPLMTSALSAIATNNSHVVLSALLQFGYIVREMGILLHRMNERCDPMVFYTEIRPFLAGSKNMSHAGLPQGVFYEEGPDEDGNEKGKYRQYSGGSNAQSSLIQFLDIILGITHTSPSTPSKTTFLTEMRSYMPGPHRAFLTHLEASPSIREYAQNSTIPEVGEAYNFAVKELERFRDIHIQIVTRYIIRPSRAVQPPAVHGGINIAVASSRSVGTKGLKGTGGTELMPFLRRVRDETRGAALG